jgi:hypothetical protein
MDLRTQPAADPHRSLHSDTAPATKWRLFFRRQAGNPRYLHDGDLITATIATATIATADRALDLGGQHTRVVGKPS